MNNLEPNLLDGASFEEVKNIPVDSVVTDVVFDVGVSSMKVVKEYYFEWFVLSIVFGVFVVLVFIYLAIVQVIPFDPRVLVVVVLPPGVVFGLARARVVSEFFKQFARLNNYSYQGKASIEICEAYFSNHGYEKSISHYVNGIFLEHHVSLFVYNFVTGFGKSRRTHSYTVFKINFASNLPEALLRPQALFTFWEIDEASFGGREKVRVPVPLEFDKQFDFYSKKDFEIEALQIFDPVLMAKLVDEYKGVSIEFFGNDAYIFYDHVVEKKVELEHAFELAKYFIEKLQPKLARMNGGVYAMKEQFGK